MAKPPHPSSRKNARKQEEKIGPARRSRGSRTASAPFLRRAFVAHGVAWICVLIVVCGFVLQRMGSQRIPPSNHKGNNVYFQEGGYYYDEFISTLVLYVRNGRLPEKYDAWQAYHPPLFTLLAGGFVRTLIHTFSVDAQTAFRSLLWIPAFIYVLFAAASYWFLRQALFALPRGVPPHLFILVFGIAVFCPGVFMLSLDVGNDLFVNLWILLTASSCAWYWRTCRWDKFNVRCVGIGLFLGLAAFTKHTGVGFAPVVAVFLGFVVLSWALPGVFHKGAIPKPDGERPDGAVLRGRFRPVVLRVLETVLAGLITLAIVQGEYRSNLKKHGKTMPSYCDGQVAQFKTWAVAKSRAKRWNYRFDLPLFVRYSFTPKYDKPLWEQPAYKNIPTSMTALFWDDMGFFSKEGASLYYYYPPKKTPPLIRVLPYLLSLGLIVPFLWAAWKNARKPEMVTTSALLCIVFFFGAWYLRCLATGDPVSVKAKYVICAMPMFLGVAMRGLAGLPAGTRFWDRIAARAITVYLSLLLAGCFVYDAYFALT
ncbi:hypothetical protein JW916_07280 [Candidatus Sumerlaeota bacterium]|nr:hypothetical protein [Candidatus Sumerlaeota bacterium]